MKRKNPTPRKVVLLDKPLPPPKKISPKRRSAETAGRKAFARPAQPTPTKPSANAHKDQLIEGTYESENLSRLCCTPDQDPSSQEPLVPTSKRIYACTSPVPAVEEPKSVDTVTPDSNKENRSLETSKAVFSDAEASESEDESDDTGYDECTFQLCTEEANCSNYFRFRYSESEATTVVDNVRPAGPLVIKKCNVVLDGNKICLEAQPVVCFMEHQPKKSSSSSSSSPKKERSSSKKSTSTSKVIPSENTKRKVDPEPASTPSIKAKVNVIAGERSSEHYRLKNKRDAPSSKRDKMEASALREFVRQENGQTTSNRKALECASPAPKMPLKLDMKKKQHSLTGSTPKHSPVTTKKVVDEFEALDTTQQMPKNVKEEDIAAVLTHLHGS